LLETVVPLSDSHHAAATDLAQQAGGKIVIDLAFSQLAHLSKITLQRQIHELQFQRS